MSGIKCFAIVASVAVVSLGSTASHAQQPPPQSPNMTFFVTSNGSGKGADLGGLEGADRHCQTLAQGAGAGGKTWRAYLSTQATGGAQVVNARDRIGLGPWQNFKGEVVAQNADDLHSDNNKLGMQTSLTERGTTVAGVGYTPNYHDVLTGSQTDGRAFPPGEDRTCRNWTTSTQGRGDGRPHRSQGFARRRRVQIVEFVTPLARPRRRLQPERSAEHRRQRLVLLLRRKLAGAVHTMQPCAACRHCHAAGASKS
jgi:hypothetical protein